MLSFFWRYGTVLFFSIGTVLMGVLTVLQRKRYQLKIWQCVGFTLLLAAVGMAGVRLLAILEHWEELLEGNPAGGMSFFGSVFLVPLLMPLLGRLFQLRPRQSLDLCAPSVAGIVGVMRINCRLTGCCGGRMIMFHSASFVPPTQIIDGVWDFLLMLFLLQWNLKREEEGTAYPLFMIGYGVMRFFVEFLRDTEKDWLSLSHGQWFSLFAIGIGVFILYQQGFLRRSRIAGAERKHNEEKMK